MEAHEMGLVVLLVFSAGWLLGRWLERRSWIKAFHEDQEEARERTELVCDLVRLCGAKGEDDEGRLH